MFVLLLRPTFPDSLSVPPSRHLTPLGLALLFLHFYYFLGSGLAWLLVPQTGFTFDLIPLSFLLYWITSIETRLGTWPV